MPFQPGESGNPKGAPRKAKIFTNALITALKKTDSEDVEAIQRIADKLVALAENGDVQAIKEVADRAEGKVPQALVGDNEEDPINLRVQKIERLIVDPKHSDSPSIPAAS